MWRGDYERVQLEQHVIGAKLMLRTGRQSEARKLLNQVSGGPLWARLLRSFPIPRFSIDFAYNVRRSIRSDSFPEL